MEIAPLQEEDIFLFSKLFTYDLAERLQKPAGLTQGLMQAIQSKMMQAFLLKEGSVAVGCASFTLSFDEKKLAVVAIVQTLYLLPDYRGQGYGSEVLSYLEKVAKSFGAEYLVYYDDRSQDVFGHEFFAEPQVCHYKKI